MLLRLDFSKCLFLCLTLFLIILFSADNLFLCPLFLFEESELLFLLFNWFSGNVILFGFGEFIVKEALNFFFCSQKLLEKLKFESFNFSSFKAFLFLLQNAEEFLNSKIGIYTDEFLTDYNCGRYEDSYTGVGKRNQPDRNRRSLSSNLF